SHAHSPYNPHRATPRPLSPYPLAPNTNVARPDNAVYTKTNGLSATWHGPRPRRPGDPSMRSAPAVTCLALLSLTALPLRAELFLLESGGQIEGRLLNPDQQP